MDIFMLIFGVIFFLGCGLHLLGNSMYHKDGFIVGGTCFGAFLLSWVIVAHLDIEPIITQHPVVQMEHDGMVKQYVFVNKREVNINDRLGGFVDKNSIIEIETYAGVWSCGVFCVMGNDTYKVLPKEQK
jgi:hypothetical protein